MKTHTSHQRSALLAALLSLAAFLPLPCPVHAADHGDAPGVGGDQAADLADLFFFRDPNDNTQAVLIATFRGFIVPGEAVNFAIFDPTLHYRFEIFNDHVNLPVPVTQAQRRNLVRRAVPNKTIDVTFTRRTALPGPLVPVDRSILQIPQAQTALIRFDGFPGISETPFTAPATNPSLAAAAPAQVVTDINTGPATVRFFAGEVDDPFFFDIPGFASFVASVRNGAPNPGVFARARDTFAGYNVMSIALRMPVSLLVGSNGNHVGLDFLTQRNRIQILEGGGVARGAGALKTVDREGNPAVNVALLPFNTKDDYNAGSANEDARGLFAGEIVATLQAFGTDAAHIGILADVAVTYGDILRLNTTVANTGTGGGNNPGAGFPNGRRLRDDTIDTLLFLITNETLTTGDGVNASEVAPNNTFPFVAPSQQPRATGVVDDNTRN